MNVKMGPCPKCRRHVFVTEEKCPFCGAQWGRSAGGLVSAAAAATILFGSGTIDASPRVPPPVTDEASQEERTKYGGPRPDPIVVAWDRVFADWETALGLGGTGESWAKAKPGTTVTYASEKLKFTATLEAKNESTLTVAVAGDGKPGKKIVRAKDALTGNVTMKIDGKTYACTVRSYDGTGKTLNIWWCADVPGGYARIEYGADTLELVKLKETVTAGGKKWDCSVWKTTLPTGTVRKWRCPDLPGGVAKWEEKHESGAAMTVEVTGVSEK
jgi:hypothetical protein